MGIILNKFFTDEAITNIVISIIGFLIVALISVCIWIFQQIYSQVKAGRKEREDMMNVIQHKFRALNNYIRTTDKVQLIHDGKIGGLVLDVAELKKKVEAHSTKLTEHGVKIENLGG